MSIYASVVGRYELGGRTSRHQYFFNHQEWWPIPHLHKYLNVIRHHNQSVYLRE